MTAGTIDLMPCLVPAMGLGAPPPTTIPAAPSFSSKQGARRNLFGSAEPGEIEALRRTEEQTKLENFKNRYNIDLKNIIKQKISISSPVAVAVAAEKTTVPTTTKSAKATTTTISLTNNNETLPSLIALEIEKHQERLLRLNALSEEQVKKVEKCNSKVENLQVIAETTPQQRKTNNSNNKNSKNSSSSSSTTEISAANRSKVSSNSCGSGTSSSSNNLGNNNYHHQSNCNGRAKPYARQQLLTECFTIRKIKQNLNGKQQFLTKTSSLTESQKFWPMELWQETASMGKSLHHHNHNYQRNHHHHQSQQQQQPQITTATTTDFIPSNSNNNNTSNLTTTKT